MKYIPIIITFFMISMTNIIIWGDVQLKKAPDIISFFGNHVEKEEKKLEKLSSIEDIIISESKKAGIDPAISLKIAKCESSLNPKATNPNSSAKGLFQITNATFLNYCDGYVFNPLDNTRCFLKLYPLKPNWWECK